MEYTSNIEYMSGIEHVKSENINRDEIRDRG
jgi:hypothetical protein